MGGGKQTTAYNSVFFLQALKSAAAHTNRRHQCQSCQESFCTARVRQNPKTPISAPCLCADYPYEKY